MTNFEEYAERNIERMYFKAKVIEQVRDFFGERGGGFSYFEMCRILHEIIDEISLEK